MSYKCSIACRHHKTVASRLSVCKAMKNLELSTIHIPLRPRLAVPKQSNRQIPVYQLSHCLHKRCKCKRLQRFVTKITKSGDIVVPLRTTHRKIRNGYFCCCAPSTEQRSNTIQTNATTTTTTTTTFTHHQKSFLNYCAYRIVEQK